MQRRLNLYTRSVFVACLFLLHALGTSGQTGMLPPDTILPITAGICLPERLRKPLTTQSL